MSEYLKREDVRRAVLHNEGDAVIAAIDELETVKAVPFDWLYKYFNGWREAVGTTSTEAVIIEEMKRGICLLFGEVVVSGKESSNDT